MTNQTHDARRKSWVASANGHSEFPLQNLPFGVFNPPGGAPRGGVAIGDRILDIADATAAGLRDMIGPHWRLAHAARDGEAATLPATIPPYTWVYSRVIDG